MAYIFPQNDNYHIRIYKIHVGTPEDKTVQGQSDFNYEVDLPEEIQEVIGMELVDWSFPRDLIPTFYPTTTKVVGNNMLDFQLVNTDISAVPGVFSVTLPLRYFEYETYRNPTRDYTQMLTQLMQEAVDADAVWKNKIRLSVIPVPFQQTLILVTTTDLLLPTASSTRLTLLFQTGQHAAESAYFTMGWDTPVDVQSDPNLFQLPPRSEALISPKQVQLRSAYSLDVFVDESPQNPLARIFFGDSGYTTNRLASDSVGRFEIDKDKPPRLLKKLHIRLRYDGNTDPGDFINGPIIAPHYMTFHIMSVQNETARRPSYYQQNLIY